MSDAFDPPAVREVDDVVRWSDFNAALKAWTDDKGFRLELILDAHNVN